MDRDETLPVRREGEIIYKDGKPVPRAPLRFEMPANVQPLTGKALQLVPEGERFKEQYMVYAPLTAGVPKLQTLDAIWRNGGVFIVHEAKDWGSYVEARMVRLDVSAPVQVDFGIIPEGHGIEPKAPMETSQDI